MEYERKGDKIKVFSPKNFKDRMPLNEMGNAIDGADLAGGNRS